MGGGLGMRMILTVPGFESKRVKTAHNPRSHARECQYTTPHPREAPRADLRHCRAFPLAVETSIPVRHRKPPDETLLACPRTCPDPHPTPIAARAHDERGRKRKTRHADGFWMPAS